MYQIIFPFQVGVIWEVMKMSYRVYKKMLELKGQSWRLLPVCSIVITSNKKNER